MSGYLITRCPAVVSHVKDYKGIRNTRAYKSIIWSLYTIVNYSCLIFVATFLYILYLVPWLDGPVERCRQCVNLQKYLDLPQIGVRMRTFIYGCFLKWWYPQNTPKWSFLVGKPMVVGYHHLRKPPYAHYCIYACSHLVSFGTRISSRIFSARKLSRWVKSSILIFEDFLYVALRVTPCETVVEMETSLRWIVQPFM